MDLHKHLCFSYPALTLCQTLKRVNPMPLTVKISLQPKFRCVAARREHGKKRRAWEGMRPPGSLAPIPPSLREPHCLTLFQAVLWSSDTLLDDTKDGELNLQICPSSVLFVSVSVNCRIGPTLRLITSVCWWAVFYSRRCARELGAVETKAAALVSKIRRTRRIQGSSSSNQERRHELGK